MNHSLGERVSALVYFAVFLIGCVTVVVLIAAGVVEALAKTVDRRRTLRWVTLAVVAENTAVTSALLALFWWHAEWGAASLIGFIVFLAFVAGGLLGERR